MFNSSAISLMVNLRLAVIHPLILLMFSSVFAVNGLPLRSSSSTDSRPLLKRSWQRKTFDLVRVSLLKHFSNISKVCAPLNPFLAQHLMQTRYCKVDNIFFLWKIETTHKDRCTQYSVTSTNVKLSSWKSDRTLMTLLPTQQKKKNWNRPNESATRWRVLKLFDQGGMCRSGKPFKKKRKKPTTWKVYNLFNISPTTWKILINISDEGSDLSRNVWLNRLNHFWTLQPIFIYLIMISSSY